MAVQQSTAIRTYRYRLYPTRAQVETMTAHLAVCCELYNAALQERREAWRICRKSVQFVEQAAQLKFIRAARPDVAEASADILTQVLRRLDRSFAAFFRRVRSGQKPGYPRFRSAARFDSLPYRRVEGLSLRGALLTLPKIGAIKVKLHRPCPSEPKTAVVKREAGKWFAYITVEVPIEPMAPTVEHVGIDVGLAHFATMSDGCQTENHRHGRRAQAKMRRCQRRIARRKRGSAGRRAAVRLFQAAHAHVRQQRADTHHKLSRALVDRYGLISVEDLNVKGLAAGILGKSVNDAGWAMFIEKLAYKAESAGRVLVKVDPRGTSQHCICGAYVPKTLKDRWHQCPKCGYSAPRDVVSAQIIDRLGLSRHAQTKETAPCVA
jgi:putative transposase